MDIGEEPLRHQPVASHRQEDTRGAEHHDEQHRRDASHAGGGDDKFGSAQVLLLKRLTDTGIHVDLAVLDHAGEDSDNADVEHRADEERGNDADGHILLRIAGFLGVGGHRIKADVGEEDDRSPRQHANRLASFRVLAGDLNPEEVDARPPIRGEWLPVVRVDEESSHSDHEQDGGDLDTDHDGVKAGALPDPLYQHNGHNGHDDHRRQVDEGTGRLEMAAKDVALFFDEFQRGALEGGRHVDADLGQHFLKV